MGVLYCIQAEDVRDDVFAQRHLALEQKEKLRWSSWERQNCCRHTTRWEHTCTHTNTVWLRKKSSAENSWLGSFIWLIKLIKSHSLCFLCLMLMLSAWQQSVKKCSHGVWWLFFLRRSASRLSGGGTGICTSGEESAEWSCGQLDADEQLQSEEWLVRSKALQEKPDVSETRVWRYVDPGNAGGSFLGIRHGSFFRLAELLNLTITKAQDCWKW